MFQFHRTTSGPHRLLATVSIVTVVAALLPGAGAGQLEDDPIVLRPDWKPGQRSRYEFWTTRQRTMTMLAGDESQSFDSSMETEGQIVWEVQRVRENGSSTCTMTLEWMTANFTDHKGATSTNDSRRSKGDTEPIHDLLRAMSGVVLKVEVAADGMITGVSGTDTIRRRAVDPDAVPKDLNFIESASDLATLAAAPVQLDVGGSWKCDFEWTHDVSVLALPGLTLPCFLHLKTTYTLDGVEQLEDVRIAMVSGEAQAKLQIDRSDIPAQAPPIDVKLVDSSYQTQVMFDLHRAEAVGRNTTEQRTIEVTIRSPQHTVGQRMVENIHSQVLRVAEAP